MEIINELLEDVVSAVNDYTSNVIDHVEFQLQLQLITSKIDRITINYQARPFYKLVRRRHTKPLEQLLFKAKYNAIQSLIKLSETNNKQALMRITADIFANKLYFHYLCMVLQNSCNAYMDKNHVIPAGSVEGLVMNEGNSLD